MTEDPEPCNDFITVDNLVDTAVHILNADDEGEVEKFMVNLGGDVVDAAHFLVGVREMAERQVQLQINLMQAIGMERDDPRTIDQAEQIITEGSSTMILSTMVGFAKMTREDSVSYLRDGVCAHCDMVVQKAREVVERMKETGIDPREGSRPGPTDLRL